MTYDKFYKNHEYEIFETPFSIQWFDWLHILLIIKILLQPNLRYADTSYLIFQQWRKGGPIQTFPLLSQYYTIEQIQNGIKNGKKSKRNSKQPKTHVYKIRDSYGKDKAAPGKNGKNFKKRKSKRSSGSENSDEHTNETKDSPIPLPPPPPLPEILSPPASPQENLNEIHECTPSVHQELSTFKSSPPGSPNVASIDEVDQFDTQLRIDEPRNTISSVDEVMEIEVSADIHRSNSESEEDTVIEANNNSLKLDRNLVLIDDSLQLDKNFATELVINEDELDKKPVYGPSMSVPIKRKQYQFDLGGDLESASSETDLEDAETLIRRLQTGVQQVVSA